MCQFGCEIIEVRVLTRREQIITTKLCKSITINVLLELGMRFICIHSSGWMSKGSPLSANFTVWSIIWCNYLMGLCILLRPTYKATKDFRTNFYGQCANRFVCKKRAYPLFVLTVHSYHCHEYKYVSWLFPIHIQEVESFSNLVFL